MIIETTGVLRRIVVLLMLFCPQSSTLVGAVVSKAVPSNAETSTNDMEQAQKKELERTERARSPHEWLHQIYQDFMAGLQEQKRASRDEKSRGLSGFVPDEDNNHLLDSFNQRYSQGPLLWKEATVWTQQAQMSNSHYQETNSSSSSSSLAVDSRMLLVQIIGDNDHNQLSLSLSDDFVSPPQTANPLQSKQQTANDFTIGIHPVEVVGCGRFSCNAWFPLSEFPRYEHRTDIRIEPVAVSTASSLEQENLRRSQRLSPTMTRKHLRESRPQRTDSTLTLSNTTEEAWLGSQSRLNFNLSSTSEDFREQVNGIKRANKPQQHLHSRNHQDQAHRSLAGSVRSHAFEAMEIDLVQAVFAAENLKGQGHKIGFLSDSFDAALASRDGGGYAADIESGDLPSQVHVVQDWFSGVSTAQTSDEGRAMMQLVHDLVPEATLAFSTAFFGNTQFASAIQELADADCHVIVDDICKSQNTPQIYDISGILSIFVFVVGSFSRLNVFCSF